MAKMHVLVCVTGQRTCERLIKSGAELTGGAEGSLSVVHVARTGQHFLGSEDEASALEYLYQVSRDYGADMSLMHSDDVCGAIVAAAKKRESAVIILGAPKKNVRGLQLPSLLRSQLPGVDVREIITSGD
ncbi:MAG: universal stress protein UspA [Eubacteriales bacterium]|nr:universal stress protein UspA [Eubacteriales bacterium]